MLLQESAQYIAPQALFDAADRLLVHDRATMLVMDEFALRRTATATPMPDCTCCRNSSTWRGASVGSWRMTKMSPRRRASRWT